MAKKPLLTTKNIRRVKGGYSYDLVNKKGKKIARVKTVKKGKKNVTTFMKKY